MQSGRQQIQRAAWKAAVLLFAGFFGNTLAASPLEDMQGLHKFAVQAAILAQIGQRSSAAAAFAKYDEGWSNIEDGVRAASFASYKDIEAAMGEVKFALAAQPYDPAAAVRALRMLMAADERFLALSPNSEYARAQQDRREALSMPEPGKPEQTPAQENQKPDQAKMQSLIDALDQVDRGADARDPGAVIAGLKQFQSLWPESEGVIAAKSKNAYADIERELGRAISTANSGRLGDVKLSTAVMRQSILPFAMQSVKYTMFDAAGILLREGMEALLVVVALFALVRKSDPNPSHGRWIWAGALAGIAASIAAAFAATAFFERMAAGTSREMIEGVTGLIAAVMLVYVGYWLHRKSSLSAWQGYLRDTVEQAVSANKMTALAVLAFLAVFREGAETVLFYIGMAPSISSSDLFLGLGAASAILAVLAFIMLALGLRIPLRPFFLAASILVYYMGFRFLGSGVHALQTAGVIGITPLSFVPAFETAGLYPTLETFVPQMILVTGMVLFWLILNSRRSEVV